MKRWRQYARFLFKFEQAYQPKILKALKKQYSSFTSDLKAHGLEHARNNLNLQTFNEDMLVIVRDIYRRVGLWGAKLQYQELQQAAKEKQKAAGFGRNEEWIRQVLDYLQLFALEFVQNISDTTRRDILKVLERGAAENLTINEIVRELTMTGLPETRSRTIARTEIVRAANVGHQMGARSFPYEVNKKWIAAGDHRTRHSHRFINNHVVDETGLFKVPVYKGDTPTGQFDEMNAPGDPDASAANTVNCRCRVIYEPKTDAKGNLILRREQAPVIPIRRTSTNITPEAERIRAIG